jgi:hypothetical protein
MIWLILNSLTTQQWFNENVSYHRICKCLCYILAQSHVPPSRLISHANCNPVLHGRDQTPTAVWYGPFNLNRTVEVAPSQRYKLHTPHILRPRTGKQNVESRETNPETRPKLVRSDLIQFNLIQNQIINNLIKINLEYKKVNL